MNDPYYNFCLEEIRFYTEKINEIINEGLKDPKKYYEESKSEWKKIYQMIPVMYMMNQCNESQGKNSDTVENLQGTPLETPSNVDSFVPALP
ncbi:hypothetical protein [Bathycoccus sp. RCC716 virus 3]|nr:hypothetical protein [Bathycoccus sp. RCC716 virus 3]|tara:strand:- start:2985 stop:3260 length:276 start_codon:yes stop_codon:yes gene_type:complete